MAPTPYGRHVLTKFLNDFQNSNGILEYYIHMNYQNNTRNYDSRVSMTTQVKSNTKVCLFLIAWMTKQNKHLMDKEPPLWHE